MLKELLRDTFAFMNPNAALDGVTAEAASRRLDGAPHSIAEIVAHMAFWQEWFMARCAGDARAMAATAAVGWPEVDEEWPALRARFLSGLDAAIGLSEDPARLAAPLQPPIEFPPLAAYTTRDVLTHIALHNSHHLGQIVTLRQLGGSWPPPSGSWTW